MRSFEMSSLIRSALASAIIGAISLAPIQLDMADAATLGRVTATTSFSSTTFKLHATTTSNGVITGLPLVLSNSNSRQFFYLRNTGGLQIESFTLIVTGSANNSAFTFKRCDNGAYFTGTNACSIGSATAFTLSSDVASFSIPAGSNIHIQIIPNKNTTPTISVSVARSQVRSGLTTNS